MEKDEKGTLIHLDLSDSQITDADLLHLKGLTKLETIHLKNTDDYPGETKITDAGVAELRKALPGCQILR